MNKFLNGLFIGAVLGAGGTVAFLMRSQTVRRVVHEEIVNRVSVATEAAIYGPENPDDAPRPNETFEEWRNRRTKARQPQPPGRRFRR